MKECPVCFVALEDNATECPYCRHQFSAEEKTEINLPVEETIATDNDNVLYSVVITRVGANKIEVIKVIKEFVQCGLADAKAKCEKGYVTGGLSQSDADALIAQLQSAGAEAEARAGEVDPASVEAPSDQKSSAGGKKNLIIGVVVGVAILLTIILLLAR